VQSAQFEQIARISTNALGIKRKTAADNHRTRLPCIFKGEPERSTVSYNNNTHSAQLSGKGSRREPIRRRSDIRQDEWKNDDLQIGGAGRWWCGKDGADDPGEFRSILRQAGGRATLQELAAYYESVEGEQGNRYWRSPQMVGWMALARHLE
jgi:hypothetical protein